MKSSTGLSLLTPGAILQLVDSDLKRVEECLKTRVRSAVPIVEDVNRYLHNSGGKRLRPALLLLSSKLCEYEAEAAIQLAVVVELIHVATLVHDDIIDDATVRRGRPSVNAKWGNQVTVLMGDWLYMTSFSLALRLRDFRILDLLIEVTRKMVEGELLQMEMNGRLDVTAEDQLEICRNKTAYLFSGCGRLGAMLGNAGPEKEEQLAHFGRSLGMAFQLTDDLLDYTASQQTLGKPVLKDLQEGKVTLPIIYLMDRASGKEREFMLRVVKERQFTAENKNRIIDLVRSYGTLREVEQLARDYAQQAQEALSGFPDSVYRDALRRLPELVINRKR